MTMIKKGVAIALMSVFLSSNSFAMDAAVKSEVRGMAKELRVLTSSLASANTESEVDKISNEMKILIDKIQEVPSYMDDFRASKSLIQALATEKYNYNNKDKADLILEDAFEKNNHRHAHLYAKILKNESLLIHDEDGYKDLIEECASYGKERCLSALDVTGYKIKNNISSSSPDEIKKVEKIIKEIKKKGASKATAEDAMYYGDALNKGFHDDVKGYEDRLLWGAASLNKQASGVLRAMYKQNIMFSPTEENIFLSEYFYGLSFGRDSNEFKSISTRLARMGSFGDQIRTEAERMIQLKQ